MGFNNAHSHTWNHCCDWLLLHTQSAQSPQHQCGVLRHPRTAGPTNTGGSPCSARDQRWDWKHRERGRERGEWCCCRTTFSLGWGVTRHTAAHLLHPGINPVVIAMVSSLLCSISTWLCSAVLCAAMRTAGMFIGLTLRKEMIAAVLFIVCNVHVKWLVYWLCFTGACSDVMYCSSAAA